MCAGLSGGSIADATDSVRTGTPLVSVRVRPHLARLTPARAPLTRQSVREGAGSAAGDRKLRSRCSRGGAREPVRCGAFPWRGKKMATEIFASSINSPREIYVTEAGSSLNPSSRRKGSLRGGGEGWRHVVREGRAGLRAAVLGGSNAERVRSLRRGCRKGGGRAEGRCSAGAPSSD